MRSKVLTLCCLYLTQAEVIANGPVHNAVETEMFAIPISPNLFNWTYQEFDQQYRFHASLLNKPELPSWLRYIYSGRHHSGFIFGTPPRNTKTPITLEVIGLNRLDYETRRLLLTLNIRPKEKMAQHEVELKIDNLNVEDLLDEHRMSRLKDIFRTKLWPESGGDLHATFLASAVDLGARLPLKPNDGEGLVVRLGSSAPLSAELKRLREEVRPLARRPACPRDYKRTTVERLYRDAGMALDWCHFELYNTFYTERTTQLLEYLTELPSPQHKAAFTPDERLPWHAPRRSEAPERRSGARRLAAAGAAPALLLLAALAALAAVLCARNYPVDDSQSDRFLDTIFHICTDRKKKSANKTSKLDVCHYETNNTEQTQLADGGSNKSPGLSPNNSLARPYSPKSSTNLAGSYNRPQPPPYLSTSNSLRHKAEGRTPEHRSFGLEESLKLLNEAKIDDGLGLMMEPKSILKEPVIDFADGMEDYVPIPDVAGYAATPDAGYEAPDLDAIVVPELSQYGLGGVAI